MTATAPAATAAYNAPDRPEDVTASFASLGDAQAYAEAYGGTIEHRGVVFSVSGADHGQAKDDLAKIRALAAAEAVAAAGGAPVATGPTAEEFDAAVAAAVARALASMETAKPVTTIAAPPVPVDAP